MVEKAPQVPKHPLQKTGRRVTLFAVFFALLSAGAFYAGATGAGVGLAVLTALYAFIGVRSGGNAQGVVLHNLAFERATRGLLDEAEALSARIPERLRTRGSLARAQGLLHALIAFQRGRLEEGVVHATRTIETEESAFGFAATPQYAVSGLGLRALLLASLGREKEARADVERAEKSPSLTPAAWARCKLASAILASKDDARREELVRVLRESRRGVEHLSPRERVLFRALERMVRIDARAAYREPGKRVEQAEAQGLSDWVSKIVPAAGAFVPQAAPPTADTAAPPDDVVQPRPAAMQEAAEASMAAVRKARVTQNPAVKRLLLWVSFVVVLGGLYAFLGNAGLWGFLPSDTADSLPSEAAQSAMPSALSWLPIALVVFLVLVIALRVRLQRRIANELSQVAMLRIRGEDDAYARKLDALSASKTPVVAASGLYSRAVLGESAGRFDAALRDVDAAMAKLHVSHATKVAAHDMLLPSIVAERAFLLAVMGRTVEAEGELEALARDYPSYPFATGAHLRIRAALALRAGDEARARQIAGERTMDMPIPVRDEVLYDLLDLASSANPSRDERARMIEELERDPEVARWVDAAADGLRERALGAGGPRVSAVSAELSMEDDEDPRATLATERGTV